MKPAKKILFATDLNEYGKPIMAYAIQYAAASGSELEVLHVVSPQEEDLDMKVMVASAAEHKIADARLQLKNYVDQVRPMIPKEVNPFPGFTEEIAIGAPSRVIVHRAKKEEVDMIVVGTRGSNRSVVDKWLGSVTSDLVKNAPCPVMVIPEGFTFQNISVITYATDMQDEDPFEIWRAVKLLSPFVPIVHVVHIDLQETVDEEALKKMEEMKGFFVDQSPGLQIQFHQLQGENLADQLNEFSFHYDSDLLVMFQPYHNFWDQLWHRSQTNKMAFSTNGPLLVLKEGNQVG